MLVGGESDWHFCVSALVQRFQRISNLVDFLADAGPRGGRQDKNPERTVREVLLIFQVTVGGEKCIIVLGLGLPQKVTGRVDQPRSAAVSTT